MLSLKQSTTAISSMVGFREILPRSGYSCLPLSDMRTSSSHDSFLLSSHPLTPLPSFLLEAHLLLEGSTFSVLDLPSERKHHPISWVLWSSFSHPHTLPPSSPGTSAAAVVGDGGQRTWMACPSILVPGRLTELLWMRVTSTEKQNALGFFSLNGRE